MNMELLKAKMNAFFANVSPEYLVEEFEKLGYEFVESDIEWKYPNEYRLTSTTCGNCMSSDPTFFNRLFGNKRKNTHEKKLTSEFPGSFFCVSL